MDWYFDFISPFAYLQSTTLARLEARRPVRRRPILFAALLSHWKHLGPAEIAPKRIWTYAHCVWLAKRHDIPLTMPPMHPFNPLPLLRLAHAAGNTPAVIDRLFRFVWVDGRLPTDAAAFASLVAECGLEPATIDAPATKEALRSAGAEALAAGVFGVPSMVVDGRVFWGFDATDMLVDYLDDPVGFDSESMRAASAVPVGPTRTEARPAAP